MDQKSAPEKGKESPEAEKKHESHGHTGHETGHQEHHKLFEPAHKHQGKDSHEGLKAEEKTKDSANQLAEAEKKYEEMLDTARRVKAEYENYKKRTDAMFYDRVDLEKIRILLEFLPAYDNLERALAAVNKDHKSEDLVKGVDMIAKQFKTSLDRLGVTEIAEKNCEFDPELHEAVTMHENPDITQETVTEVFEKGYKLNGRIIRHAKVVVDIPFGPKTGTESGPVAGSSTTAKKEEQIHGPGESGAGSNMNEKNPGGTNG